MNTDRPTMTAPLAQPNQPAHIECMIPVAYTGWRLDRALADLYPSYSRARLKSFITEQRVQLDGRIPKAHHTLTGGEHLLAWPINYHCLHQPEYIALDIIYEDDALIVVNKPAQLVVHPAISHRSGTLLNTLLYHYPELKNVPRAGIVHRLDKDTTGLMVVARTEPAHISLIQQLKLRTVRRVYLALVHGIPADQGTIDAPIGRHPRVRTRMAVTSAGKPARTHFKRLEAFHHHSYMQMQLDSGRTHQIRVHMSYHGYPLIGDQTYNCPKPRLRDTSDTLQKQLQTFNRQALHATELALVHPHTQAPIQWQIPSPVDFQTLLTQLRQDCAHPHASA